MGVVIFEAEGNFGAFHCSQWGRRRAHPQLLWEGLVLFHARSRRDNVSEIFEENGRTVCQTSLCFRFSLD